MNFTSPLGRCLFWALKGLCDILGLYGRGNPALGAVVGVLSQRLARLKGRFDRLVLLWERAQLPAPRVRAKRPASARKAVTPGIRMPTGFGWVQKIVPSAHMQAGLVGYLLQDPDVRALVEAAPQAGRLLRPLCHALGTELPAWLRPPERVRKPRAPKPRATPSARGERQGPARGFTRRQIDGMTVAELVAHYGKLPPHFPLPIPNLGYIRRKIAAG
jgi:hypothetical protein